eukprot:127992_1
MICRKLQCRSKLFYSLTQTRSVSFSNPFTKVKNYRDGKQEKAAMKFAIKQFAALASTSNYTPGDFKNREKEFSSMIENKMIKSVTNVVSKFKETDPQRQKVIDESNLKMKILSACTKDELIDYRWIDVNKESLAKRANVRVTAVDWLLEEFLQLRSCSIFVHARKKRGLKLPESKEDTQRMFQETLKEYQERHALNIWEERSEFLKLDITGEVRWAKIWRQEKARLAALKEAREDVDQLEEGDEGEEEEFSDSDEEEEEVKSEQKIEQKVEQ